MLTAIAPWGTPELAVDALRESTHWCPECDEEVILKRGPVVVPHFAHRVDTGCPLSEGESMRHLQMKSQIGELFRGATYEVRFGSTRRADVVLSDRVVVECQASSINIDEIKARTQFYNSQDHAVLWVFDRNRLGQRRYLSFGGIEIEHEMRVPVDVRYIHAAAYGFLYILGQDGVLRGCHLARAGERETEYGTYTPKTLKWVSFHRAGRVPIRFKSSIDEMVLVKLGEGVWWKQKAKP